MNYLKLAHITMFIRQKLVQIIIFLVTRLHRLHNDLSSSFLWCTLQP